MSGTVWRAGLKQRLQDTLVELCSIPSPTFQERKVANYIRDTVKSLGLDVKEDEAGNTLGGDSGNLICELPGDLPERIVLVSHMDTVPPVPGVPLQPMVDGDRIHTGGRQILGADNKAGVTVALELLRGLQALPSTERPTVIAVFTIAEERGLLGARQLDVASLNADFAYVLDGEVPVGEVIATAPYKEALKLTIPGRRAHAALEPERGIHAIAVAARVVSSFPLGRPTETSVTNLGIIEGGTATNVIPDEVTLHGELRSFTNEELESLAARIMNDLAAESHRSGVDIQMERTRLYDGYDVPLDAPSLRRLSLTAQQQDSIDLRKVASIGGSDTNILIGKGLEAVDVGLGMHEIHSKDEWILTSDLERVTLWLFSALITAERT